VKKTAGGRWHAFLTTSNRELRVVQLAEAQPWAHATKLDALRILRPTVQVKAVEARKAADEYDAALDAIDAEMEGR